MTLSQRFNIVTWLDALRSGQYPAGTTWLLHGNRYSALGVACQLFAPATRLIHKLTIDSEPVWFWGEFGNSLPCGVKAQLGLRTNCGTYSSAISRGYMRSLYSNCTAGVPWLTLANFVEQEMNNPKTLLFAKDTGQW